MAPLPQRKTYSAVEISRDDITLKFTQTNEAENQRGQTTLDITIQEQVADFRGDTYSKPVKVSLPEWVIEEIASYGSRYMPILRPDYRAF